MVSQGTRRLEHEGDAEDTWIIAPSPIVAALAGDEC